ncbi:MAG: site-2 protease family protein [Leptospiraceae bacterium]|nr:site-2 protease family protein [Leptospiraceae bacterium]
MLFTGDGKVAFEILSKEWSYSVALILILFSHEMGHYIPARYYGIRATLPYFIPFPFGPIGTMGAVIRIKDAIPDKEKLFDIGVGGPVMSLILSIPCWVVGLYLSELVPIDNFQNKSELIFFGDSIFTYFSGQWILGPYNTQQFDVMIHPLAKAGWVGLLVTAINLLPFGQLDGGHVIYSVFGEKYRRWIYYLFLAFMLLSLWNFSWLVWTLLIYFIIKVEHPYIPDSHFPLTPFRKKLGIFMLLSLVFIFVPSPIFLGSEMEKSSILENIWKSIFGS